MKNDVVSSLQRTERIISKFSSFISTSFVLYLTSSKMLRFLLQKLSSITFGVLSPFYILIFVHLEMMLYYLSKAVLLLWIFVVIYVSRMSMFLAVPCYLKPCDHLVGKV